MLRTQTGSPSQPIGEGFERLEPVTAAIAGQPYGLREALKVYRKKYLVERAMGRLQGRFLSLTLRYLEREDHSSGLIRLLPLGLWVLTLRELGVRRGLATVKITRVGLAIGNPKRATAFATAKRLLDAGQGLPLTSIQ